MDAVTVKVLGPGDESVLASVDPDVFDDGIDAAATREFLNDARHHIVVAIAGETVIGFVSAVHYVHPDKPRPELWINEAGVAEPYQGQGIGKAMMDRMLALGRELGCGVAWVLTEEDNERANRLYASRGGTRSDAVMYSFALTPECP